MSSPTRAQLLILSSSSAANRFLALGLSLITIPIALKYLGAERFGVWMAINSMASLLALADLGVGTGLVNAVARANGSNESLKLLASISSSAIATFILSLVFAVIAVVVVVVVDWAQIFHLRSERAAAEAPYAVMVFVTCQLISLPFTLAYRVQSGLQRAHLGEIWLMIATLLGFIAWLVAIEMELSLPWLIAAIYVPILLANLGNSVALFVFQFPSLRPTLDQANVRGVRNALSTGSLFLVIQITATVGFGLDYLIISSSLGAVALADFAIITKLFGLISMAAAMILKPLWPAYAEAWARGNKQWVRTTAKKSVLVSACISAIAAVGLFLFAEEILLLWTGRAVTGEFMLILYSAIWVVIQSVGSAYAMLLNGLHVLRFQIVIGVSFALLSIFLKLITVDILGTSGVILASIGAYILTALVPYLLFARHYLNR